jgi:hypothetical protein
MEEVIFLSFGFFASSHGEPSGVNICLELLAVGGGGCGNVLADVMGVLLKCV